MGSLINAVTLGRTRPRQSISTIGAVLIACSSFAAVSQQDGRSLFQSNRAELAIAGVHRLGGFVYSTVRCPTLSRQNELSRRAAPTAAVRQMLESHVAAQLSCTECTPTVQRAAAAVGLSCLERSIAFQGLETVCDEVEGSEFVVVRCIPAAKLDALRMDRDQVMQCVLARADKGAISVPEAMVLLELCPDASPLLPKVRGIAVAAFSSAYGSGIGLTVRGAWTNEEKTVPADALELWTLSASNAVARGNSLSDALAPIGPAFFASRDLEERFAFLGHRMHDPNAIAALAKSLTDDGWLRAAEVMSAKLLPLAVVRDHHGFKLSPDLRAKIASTPIVTLLLLTAGQANVALTTGAESQLLIDGRAAFDRKELAHLLRAATLLQQSIASEPQIEAMVLLGATLLALDDPALALPICTAAFRAVPAHRYAGINLLRALRALELKDEARAILPNVRRDSGSHLSKWGIDRLALIETWIDPKSLPVPAAP